MHIEKISEKKCLEEYIEIATSFNPTLSIEVGAHKAEYSRAISSKGVKSIAFEASPAVYEKYKENINTFEYINLAISDYAGSVLFNIDSAYKASNIGHNSIKKYSENGSRNNNPIEVSCSSLDIYFNDLQDEKISMWIDVEGANREVLMGATELLKKVQTIYIEVEHKQFWVDQWQREDVIDFLSVQGFELHREFFAYRQQTNCIFIKK
jgi:FkbM family methyltransferase